MAFRTLDTPTGTSGFRPLSAIAPTDTPTTPAPEATNNYNATFPASPSDTPVVAGLKATGNLPSSAINFGSGLLNAVEHPIDTLSGLGNAVLGGVQKAVKATTGYELPQTDAVKKADATFNALGSVLKDRYGSLENLQKTATNDPFGFGADVLSIIDGGATLAGKSEELGNLISKTSSVVTKPVSKIADLTTSGVSNTTRFGVSQATGLSPETITNIGENPSAFSKDSMAQNTRTNLAQSVKDTIDQRLANLSDTGQGYQTIRDTGGTVDVKPIEIPNANGTSKVTTVDSILNDNGIKLVDGKVKTTSESAPLSSADKTALEDFLNVYGNEKTLSNNAFLNTRSALSQLSKYDAAKTGNLEGIARELRSYYDTLGKEQITGLSPLDAKYAPEVTQLKQIKKDYLQPNGDFKDGAINKIANLTGKGKDQVLSRLEAIHPGVTQRIKIMKAAEDIQAASGLKVGTYARAGGLVGGIATGNIPLVISSILAVPEVAVPLIRGLGFTKNAISPIVDILKNMANDVNGLRLPGQIKPYVENYLLKNPKVSQTLDGLLKVAPTSASAIQKGQEVKKLLK